LCFAAVVFDVARLDVHHGLAVRLGERFVQASLGDEPQLEEVRSKTSAVQDLVLDRLFELMLADDPAVPENPSQDGQKSSPLTSGLF
jgi:hypothetical protein